MADRGALEAAAAAGVIKAEQVGPLHDFLASQAAGVSAAPSGEEDLRFIRNFHDLFLATGIVLLAIGLFASWLGTLCWNEASQRLPTTLAGQLIVFETLSALAYAFALRGRWPQPVTVLGILLLIAGVAWALRARPQPLAAEGHAG